MYGIWVVCFCGFFVVIIKDTNGKFYIKEMWFEFSLIKRALELKVVKIWILTVIIWIFENFKDQIFLKNFR